MQAYYLLVTMVAFFLLHVPTLAMELTKDIVVGDTVISDVTKRLKELLMSSNRQKLVEVLEAEHKLLRIKTEKVGLLRDFLKNASDADAVLQQQSRKVIEINEQIADETKRIDMLRRTVDASEASEKKETKFSLEEPIARLRSCSLPLPRLSPLIISSSLVEQAEGIMISPVFKAVSDTTDTPEKFKHNRPRRVGLKESDDSKNSGSLRKSLGVDDELVTLKRDLKGHNFSSPRAIKEFGTWMPSSIQFLPESIFKCRTPREEAPVKLSVLQGTSQEQFALALAFEEGRSVARDQRQAIFWYHEAANRKNAQAQMNLALCFAKGLGVERNFEQAFFWIHQAAEAHLEQALLALGLCYFYGEGTKKNMVLSREIFQQLADKGNSYALSYLGLSYLNDDNHKAITHFEKLLDSEILLRLEKESSMVFFNLGLLYAHTSQIEKSLKMYFRAAAQGHGPAQVNLALLHQFGVGTPKNLAEAIKWYARAAQKEYPPALFYLSLCYADLNDSHYNATEAEILKKKAAFHKFPPAQYAVGMDFWNGSSKVDKDYVRAVTWLKNAAKMGHHGSYYQLGVAYENGFGIEQDTEKAIMCYKLASGISIGMHQLAFLFDN